MRFIKRLGWEVEEEVKISFLSGPVYMVSGTRESPPPRDNFTERLHNNCVTETKLTLLNYAHIESLKIRVISCSSFFYIAFFKYSCVFNSRNWTDTSKRSSNVSFDCSEDFGAKKLFKANAGNIHQPPKFCLSSLGILSCI